MSAKLTKTTLTNLQGVSVNLQEMRGKIERCIDSFDPSEIHGILFEVLDVVSGTEAGISQVLQ
ncbi:MAG: hypothetical protein LUG50_06875 [Planctomycetaceae bacterium]|nr:hypothetical protein [Planctomycetaceae bacterium]